MSLSVWKKKMRSIALFLCAYLLLGNIQIASSDEFGNASNGKLLAVEICSECHNIGMSNDSQAAKSGPSFESIAALPSTTRMSLTAWFRSPHPSMPSIILTEKESSDIISYILELK